MVGSPRSSRPVACLAPEPASASSASSAASNTAIECAGRAAPVRVRAQSGGGPTTGSRLRCLTANGIERGRGRRACRLAESLMPLDRDAEDAAGQGSDACLAGEGAGDGGREDRARRIGGRVRQRDLCRTARRKSPTAAERLLELVDDEEQHDARARRLQKEVPGARHEHEVVKTGSRVIVAARSRRSGHPQGCRARL